MNQIKKFSLLSVFLLTLFSGFSQKNPVSIKFNIDNYESDTLLIGYYFGDKTLVYDTLLASKPGKFELTNEELIPSGVYLAIYQPDNSFFQFLVNQKDQKFTLKGGDGVKHLIPSGSEDNEIFNNYINFIAEKSKIREEISQQIDTLQKQGKDISKWEDKASKLDLEVKEKQKGLVEKYPQTITARLISSNFSTDFPEFTGSEEEINMQKYLFFKKHYFDHIDLGDPAQLRTPYIHDRIDYYVEKLTPQQTDSIAKSVDYLLSQMEPAPETFQFYTSYFLNKYANSNVIGFDALYVHMIDKYYNNGKTPWVSEENMKKFIENAEKIRPILIGEKAPPITFYDEADQPVSLYDIKAEYTVMIFWAPDCGHCKKAMPGLISFYEKWKERGVEVLGICTKHRDKTDSCWEFQKEKELPWITVADRYHKSRFRDIYNVVSTPRVFILDKNKEILLKRVPTDKMDEIMEAIVIDMEKKAIGSER